MLKRGDEKICLRFYRRTIVRAQFLKSPTCFRSTKMVFDTIAHGLLAISTFSHQFAFFPSTGTSPTTCTSDRASAWAMPRQSSAHSGVCPQCLQGGWMKRQDTSRTLSRSPQTPQSTHSHNRLGCPGACVAFRCMCGFFFILAPHPTVELFAT